jgi:hypothetical protein
MGSSGTAQFGDEQPSAIAAPVLIRSTMAATIKVRSIAPSLSCAPETAQAGKWANENYRLRLPVSVTVITKRRFPRRGILRYRNGGPLS